MGTSQELQNCIDKLFIEISTNSSKKTVARLKYLFKCFKMNGDIAYLIQQLFATIKSIPQDEQIPCTIKCTVKIHKDLYLKNLCGQSP